MLQERLVCPLLLLRQDVLVLRCHLEGALDEHRCDDLNHCEAERAPPEEEEPAPAYAHIVHQQPSLGPPIRKSYLEHRHEPPHEGPPTLIDLRAGHGVLGGIADE